MSKTIDNNNLLNDPELFNNDQDELKKYIRSIEIVEEPSRNNKIMSIIGIMEFYGGYPSSDILKDYKIEISDRTFEKFKNNILNRYEDNDDSNYEIISNKLSEIILNDGNEMPNIIYTHIEHYNNVPCYFRFLNNGDLTYGKLLYIYTIAYRLMYMLENKHGKIVQLSPFMLNRGTSNGPYQIWGHDIGDLIYNGGSKLEIYEDYIICDFSVDS